MKQYVDLGYRVLNNGNKRNDRTLTGTISLFGPQMEFDLQQGFPLLTTKKLFTKAIIHELLWFLTGDTNNENLVKEGVHIWDEWALSENFTMPSWYGLADRCEMLAKKLNMRVSEAAEMLQKADEEHPEGHPHGGLKILEENEIPKQYDVILQHKGELGPIYSKQWIKWRGSSGYYVNQIEELIKNLTNNPFSRRHVVSAWNVSDLPDESMTPQDNVRIGKMALAPCHCLFQFYVEEMNISDRIKWVRKNMLDVEEGINKQLKDEIQAGNFTSPDDDDWDARLIKRTHELYGAVEGVPYKLSCKLYQRSADYALGVPFNIASYALFTMMVAQCVNMVPGTFIHTFGDCHLYTNHVEKFKEQLDRPIRNLPIMKINPDVKNIFDFKFEDFTLEGYDPHPKIDYPVSV